MTNNKHQARAQLCGRALTSTDRPDFYCVRHAGHTGEHPGWNDDGDVAGWTGAGVRPTVAYFPEGRNG